MSSQKLDELGVRIERLTSNPADIRAPLVRLMRPILARLGYGPKVSSEKAQALLAELRRRDEPSPTPGAVPAERLMLDAVAELEDSLTSVERATVVGKRTLVAYAAWLRRLYEVLVRASRAIEDRDDDAAALAGHASFAILPPLAVQGRDAAAKGQDKDIHAQSARLVDLELAAVDHILAAAMTEVEVLGRRRRLLEAARQMLLESSAAVPLDAAGVEARRRHIAGEITRIDRLQAAGVSPDVTLAHQLREAMTRGERDRLHAALVAMNSVARGAGDERAYALSRRAIAEMWHGDDPRTPLARQRSMERSAKQALGDDFTETVKSAYDAARKRYETLRQNGDDSYTVNSALTYFDASSSSATLSATLAVDGAFEVGGALLPIRIEEIERRYRAVRWPTQEMWLMPATEPVDIPDAIIDDPRTIVLDLAAGRLLARRFVKEELLRHPKTILRGEVRVYVLDGSGSMMGPRSRMRDAIVCAELLTLKRRLLEGAKLARVVFFYRYFDTEVHPTVRVDTPAAVELAFGDVLGNLREGGTDIEKALLASFEQVRSAKASDPDLAQAQIVLVTDGEAAVDEPTLDRARSGVGDLTVGLSVIALGQENPALRALVANQRAKGERAFYHFIPDDSLEAVVRGEVDSGLPLHLPEVHGSTKPQALSADLGNLVEEMSGLGRARELEALEGLDAQAEGMREAGVEESALTEGERARARALYRDRRSLEMQFLRWFPAPGAKAAPSDVAADIPADDVEAALVALATVSEVVAVTLGSDLARRADAIDVLERLLPDAALTPARYFAVVGHPTAKTLMALRMVHAAVTPAT